MRRHLSILALACGLTFFLGLGRAAISDSDEAFYAEASREMVETGDWLTPHYNYEPRFQKPILYYWLAASAFSTAGVAEAAARVPAALAGLGLAFLTYACGRRWLEPRSACIGGLIVATNFGYFFIGRLSLPDLPLAFFISAASFSALEAIRVGRELGPRAARRWLVAAALASALGFLTKGPVGIALPGLVAAAVLSSARPASGGRWWPFRIPDLLLAGLLFAVVAIPWYAAMADRHGSGYLHRFFVGENLDRFATDRYNEPRPVGYYVPVLIGGLLPWSPFMLLWTPGIASLVKGRAKLDAAQWRLLVWAGLPLAFYSLSVGKQPRYILPVLPPLALLVAQGIRRRMERTTAGARGVDPWLASCATLGAVVLVVLGVLLHRGKPLLFALDPSAGAVGTGVILVAGLAVALVAWSGRPRQLVVTMAAASAATLLALYFCVYSAAGLEPVQRMASLVEAHRSGPGTRIGTYRVFVRNLVFYTRTKMTDLREEQQVVEFLTSADPVLCVIAEDDLDRLARRHGFRVRRIADMPYHNAAGLRLRTLLWPDPARDLETVLLVGSVPPTP